MPSPVERKEGLRVYRRKGGALRFKTRDKDSHGEPTGKPKAAEFSRILPSADNKRLAVARRYDPRYPQESDTPAQKRQAQAWIDKHGKGKAPTERQQAASTKPSKASPTPARKVKHRSKEQQHRRSKTDTVAKARKTAQGLLNKGMKQIKKLTKL